MLLFLLLLGWLAVCCCGTPPRGAAVPIAICCCCCCCIWCCKNCNCAMQRKDGEKIKLAEGISVCCYKRQNAHVACVSEAELQPGMANKRSVQTNTQEWLMGCRGRRRIGESWGREGSEAGDSQAAPGGAPELQIIGCDLRSETCSTATMLSAQSKSATSTGNRQQHLRIHAHSVTACHL